MENKVIGYYVLWRVPELDARYDDLAELAGSLGIEEKYIPTPPKRRGAWEKATNLGRNYPIEPPFELVQEVQRKYGVTPTVRLETVIVSKSAPVLIRHIVRRVTIPASDESSDKRRLAERQLDQQTVCIMQFDCNTEAMQSTGYSDLRDFAGWVNGNLRDIVQSLHEDVDRAMNRESGSKVRDGIREFLLDNGGVLQTAGGAYFLPYTPELYDSLKAVKVYLEGCTDWAAKRNDDGSPADRPSFVVIPLVQTDEALDTILDIAQSAEAQFSQNIEEMIDELSPLFKGDRSEKVANNIRARVNDRYARMQENVRRYKIALDDSLPRLDALLDKARQLIDQAMAVDTYRVGRKMVEAGQVEAADVTGRGQRVMESITIDAVSTGKKSREL